MSDEILNGDTDASASSEANAAPAPGGESDLAAAGHAALPPITEQTVVVDSHSDTVEAHAGSEVPAQSDASKQPDSQHSAPAVEASPTAAPVAAVAASQPAATEKPKREDHSSNDIQVDDYSKSF